MSFRSLSPEDVISGYTGIVRAGFECGKIVVGYCGPAFAKSANLTAEVYIHPLYTEVLNIVAKIRQAANWGAQNPVSATYAAIGTVGAVVLAAPGLATAPILSIIGFTAEGIQAGMCNNQWKGSCLRTSKPMYLFFFFFFFFL